MSHGERFSEGIKVMSIVTINTTEVRVGDKYNDNEKMDQLTVNNDDNTVPVADKSPTLFTPMVQECN